MMHKLALHQYYYYYLCYLLLFVFTIAVSKVTPGGLVTSLCTFKSTVCGGIAKQL